MNHVTFMNAQLGEDFTEFDESDFIEFYGFIHVYNLTKLNFVEARRVFELKNRSVFLFNCYLFPKNGRLFLHSNLVEFDANAHSITW